MLTCYQATTIAAAAQACGHDFRVGRLRRDPPVGQDGRAGGCAGHPATAPRRSRRCQPMPPNGSAHRDIAGRIGASSDTPERLLPHRTDPRRLPHSLHGHAGERPTAGLRAHFATRHRAKSRDDGRRRRDWQFYGTILPESLIQRDGGLDRKEMAIYINADESTDGAKPPGAVHFTDQDAPATAVMGNSSTVELRTLTPSI